MWVKPFMGLVFPKITNASLSWYCNDKAKMPEGAKKKWDVQTATDPAEESSIKVFACADFNSLSVHTAPERAPKANDLYYIAGSQRLRKPRIFMNMSFHKLHGNVLRPGVLSREIFVRRRHYVYRKPLQWSLMK